MIQFLLIAVGALALTSGVLTGRRAGRLPHGTIRARRHRQAAALDLLAALLFAASAAFSFLSN